MVWALVLVAVAAIAAFFVMRAKNPATAASRGDADDETDETELDTPPIVDAPKPQAARPKQILTPGGTQPLSKRPVDSKDSFAPPRVTASRLPSSIPLEDPLGDLELGAPGAGEKLPESRSKYTAPEVVFDPSTPSIPLAADDEPRRTKSPTAQPVTAQSLNAQSPSTQPLTARTKSATIPPGIRNKAPSIPPAELRTKSPTAELRTRSPTAPPPDLRSKSPTVPPAQPAAAESGLSMRTKRPSSSPPLADGGVVVRMKPPTQPPALASDTPKRGTPGTGVVIRAKPPTTPPMLDGSRRGTPGSGVPTGRTKTPGSVPQIELPPEPEVVPPAGLANKLHYATLTATISHVGIDARREDGVTRKVMWPDVVGIVARRMPPDDPYDGTTFVDIVSTAGATLRILPWTHLGGDRIDGDGTERARALVQLAAARCPGAKLDAATRTFLGSHGQAAQLPDEPTLEAHDKRLS